MTNPESPEDQLSDAHLARFGSIVTSFAKFEYLISCTMAAVAGVEDMKIVFLTKALTYSQKRDTLYSYMTQYVIKQAVSNRIIEIVDEAHGYSGLRNNIAHAIWVKGTREGSIRPGYVDVRYGKGRILGYGDGERDYTVDELGDAANAMLRLSNELIRYLRDSGIAPDIATNIERANVFS